MAGYWQQRVGGEKESIRLLSRDGRWLPWLDREPDPDNPAAKRISGCHQIVEDKLLESLHSTNVIVLLGSGASFCARNVFGNQAPGMSDLWHAVREAISRDDVIDHETFDELAQKVMGGLPASTPGGKPSAGNIESLLSLCKMSIELLQVRAVQPDFSEKAWLVELQTFVALAETTILERVSFVDSDTQLTAHMSFLQKFARRTSEKPRVKIFTTNYDLCIETAALRRGVVLVDGFSHSAEQRFNRDHYNHDIVRRPAVGTKAEYLDGVAHLYKLHGSVDWRRRKDGVVIRSLEKSDADLRPVLIYPRSSKYQEAFESPYLDMFAAFQAALREPDTTLIISGFGFADDHISSPIWAAVETNLSLRIIVCDSAFVPEDNLAEAEDIDLNLAAQRNYQQRLMKLVLQGDTRVTMLNGRFEDLADALPTVSGRTDRQLLQDRLEAIVAGAGN